MRRLDADIRSALQGDDAAFGRICDRVESEIRKILMLELRHRGDANPEEALQDVFIYMAQKLDIYDPQYPFETFVRGLTRTVAVRHKARKPLGSPRIGPEGDGELSDELLYERLNLAGSKARQVIGFGRLSHCGSLPSPSPMFMSLLELLFSEGGYPHQQLAFAYNIILFGRKRNLSEEKAAQRLPDIFGTPERVVQEVGPLSLRQAARELQGEIQATLGAGRDLDRIFSPLFVRLKKTGREVFAGDNISLRYLAHLAEAVIGDTRLEQYFGKDPRKSITDWSYTVCKRLRTAVGEKGLGDVSS